MNHGKLFLFMFLAIQGPARCLSELDQFPLFRYPTVTKFLTFQGNLEINLENIIKLQEECWTEKKEPDIEDGLYHSEIHIDIWTVLQFHYLIFNLFIWIL